MAFLPQNEFRSAHYANKALYFTFCDIILGHRNSENTHIEKNGFLVKINMVAKGA
jgi:hypothetical protein